MNYSADVQLVSTEDDAFDLEGAEVTVNGHNLSEELIAMLAKHATAVELGVGSDELEDRITDWNVEEGTERSVVRISFRPSGL